MPESYKPSEDEIKEAEGRMSPEEAELSQAREDAFAAGRESVLEEQKAKQDSSEKEKNQREERIKLLKEKAREVGSGCESALSHIKNREGNKMYQVDVDDDPENPGNILDIYIKTRQDYGDGDFDYGGDFEKISVKLSDDGKVVFEGGGKLEGLGADDIEVVKKIAEEILNKQ